MAPRYKQAWGILVADAHYEAVTEQVGEQFDMHPQDCYHALQLVV